MQVVHFALRWLAFACITNSIYLRYSSAAEDRERKGHLQPLGSHRLPGIIEERSDIPTPLEFWEKYVKLSNAVVFRGAGKHSRAFQQWTDDYLQDNFGGLEVRLEGKDERSDRIPVGSAGLGRDTIANFVGHYHKTNSYIVSELPTPMWPDVSVPPCLTCGMFVDRIVEVDLWMSGGDSKSILHKDAFNAVNCVFNGSKHWKMIEYKYENMIYKAWEPGQEIGGYSLINVDSVDLLKFPKIADVPWSFVEVNAGDCLFVPKSYYHQVSSFGSQNIAVSMLFSRFDDLDSYDNDGCESHIPPRYMPLSAIDVHWKYPGYGNMTMGNVDLYFVKNVLLNLVEEHGTLTIEHLNDLVKRYFNTYTRRGTRVTKIFEFLTHEDSSEITEEDVTSLDKDDLRTLALLLERYEPSNTYTHEYSYVLDDDIRTALHRLIVEDNGVEREKFVKCYTEELGGSEQFASEIFAGFKSKRSDKASAEEVLQNLEVVLRPYVEYRIDRPSHPEQDFEEEDGNLDEGPTDTVEFDRKLERQDEREGYPEDGEESNIDAKVEL